MTAKKAIEFLRMHFEYLKERWKPYPDYNVLEAIRFAISAIEKQIPKKPIRHKCCGNCKYHQYEDISQGWVCCNKDSEYIADWTDYTDYCEEWESR